MSLLFSCRDAGKPDDSTEVAEERNEVRFTKSVYKDDVSFTTEIAERGMLEVKASNLALARTSNPDVRALAELIKSNQLTINAELRALAAARNIDLPDSITGMNQNRFERLAKKSGAEFDEEYVEMMIDMYDNDIELFGKESMNGSVGEIRTWAAQKLPTIHRAHDKSRSTEQKLTGVY